MYEEPTMEQTALDNLVLDNREDGVFRVHRSAFTDPEIMTLEQRRVFEQCWIYAGHASEIPQPGDFRARRVAGRPVILVRGSDGVIRVLLNTCTHRGAQICRDFIFISFNPTVESLVDYLAGAKHYLDLVCDQSEAGMEIVTGTQAYSMRANWKLLVENSMDGYHARTTHQRYFEFLVETGVDASLMRRRRGGMGKSLGNGHAVIQSEPAFGRPIARWTPMFGEEKRAELEAIYQQMVERFGAEWAYQMTQTSRNLLIFPNLIINDIMAITVRTFFPVAPDYIEINAWALAPKDESPDNRALRLDNFLTFLGPGGFATPDDVEMLEACQRGYANVREVEWSDISRGMKRKEPLATDELQMQVFWRRWNELITRPRPARVREAA